MTLYLIDSKSSVDAKKSYMLAKYFVESRKLGSKCFVVDRNGQMAGMSTITIKGADIMLAFSTRNGINGITMGQVKLCARRLKCNNIVSLASSRAISLIELAVKVVDEPEENVATVNGGEYPAKEE